MRQRTSPVIERLEERALLSSLAYSLTTDQSVYQVGQPIEMTYTEVNTSDQPITIFDQQPAGFTVTHNGTAVMLDALPQIVVLGTQTLQPGQTLTDSQPWNGIPMLGPYTLDNLTGTFFVAYGPEGDPTEFTMTFQIVAPSTSLLTTAVTTDQPVYDFGAPAQLTFTETDTGSQPVAVLTGPTAFEITQNEMDLWDSTTVNDLAGASSWETLRPGQSYTQTITWDGSDGYDISSPEGTGTFAVSDLLDPNASSATFQILSAPYPSPLDPPPSNPPPSNPPPSNPPPSNPPPSNLNPAPPGSITSPPPVAITLSTEHVRYAVGRSVAISVVMKNVTASKVAVRHSHGVETVTVRQGSTVVYESARKARAFASESIKPGHALTLTTVWSGTADQAGIKKLHPGAYTITVDDDGYVASTTVKLVARRK